MRVDFRKFFMVSLFAAVAFVSPCSQSFAATYDQEDFQAYTQEFQQKLKDEAKDKMADAFKQIRCYEKRMNADKVRQQQKEAGKKATPYVDDTWPTYDAAKGITDKLGGDLFDGCNN
ncbi:MAG: hypothetical protein SFW65_03170 [Alphaproteobacteria bacterium]|nr:hypothetical protein [Alphaproteobacteria bacterium]